MADTYEVKVDGNDILNRKSKMKHSKDIFGIHHVTVISRKSSNNPNMGTYNSSSGSSSLTTILPQITSWNQRRNKNVMFLIHF